MKEDSFIDPFSGLEPTFNSGKLGYGPLERLAAVLAYNVIYRSKKDMILFYPFRNTIALLYIILGITWESKPTNPIKCLVISSRFKKLKETYDQLEIEGKGRIASVKGAIIFKKGKNEEWREDEKTRSKAYSKKIDPVVVFSNQEVLHILGNTKYKEYFNLFDQIIIDGFDELLWKQEIIKMLFETFPKANILFYSTNPANPSWKSRLSVWRKEIFVVGFPEELIYLFFKWYIYTNNIENTMFPILKLIGGDIVQAFIPEENMLKKHDTDFKVFVIPKTEQLNDLSTLIQEAIDATYKLYNSISPVQRPFAKYYFICIRHAMQTLFPNLKEGFRYGVPRTFLDAWEQLDSLLSHDSFLGIWIETKKYLDEIRMLLTTMKKTPKLEYLEDMISILEKKKLRKLLIVVSNTLIQEELERYLSGKSNVEIRVIPYFELPFLTENYDSCIFLCTLPKEYESHYLSPFWKKTYVIAYMAEAISIQWSWKRIAKSKKQLIAEFGQTIEYALGIHNFKDFLKNIVRFIPLKSFGISLRKAVEKNEVKNICTKIYYTIRNVESVDIEVGPSFYSLRNGSLVKARKFDLTQEIPTLTNTLVAFENKVNKEFDIKKIENFVVALSNPDELWKMSSELEPSRKREDWEKEIQKIGKNYSLNKKPAILLYLDDSTVLFASEKQTLTVRYKDRFKQIIADNCEPNQQILIVNSMEFSFLRYILEMLERTKEFKEITRKNLEILFSWRRKSLQFMEKNKMSPSQFASLVKKNGAKVQRSTIENWFEDDIYPLTPRYEKDIVAIARTINDKELLNNASEIKRLGDYIRGIAAKWGKIIIQIITQYYTGKVSFEDLEVIAKKQGFDLASLLARVEIRTILDIHKTEVPAPYIRKRISLNELINVAKE